MSPTRMPQVRQQLVQLQAGMDTATSPSFAKPGTPRLLYNYEPAVSGGVGRISGIEPFDGRAAPSAAAYQLLECSAGVANVAIGDTLTGDTSGATGVVTYVTATQVAVTQVAGDFELELVQVGVLDVGTVTDLEPSVDGFLDNILTKAAADVYQALIVAVPGSGIVRGVAIHDEKVYAWRNNAGGTALAVYSSSGAGWVAVPLYYELSFTGGSVQPAEASTLTQGAVSATVKRVVLESGTWGAGTAAGRYILTTPSGGSFIAGAITTAGAGTVPAAGPGVYLGTQITLAPDGRVRTDRFNFTGSTLTTRLYGCDGVNREFELDDDILVPIVTGMGSIRAQCVRAHKNVLFYAYRGSLQHSGIGQPYAWSVVLGAAEIAAGDTITNLVSVGGSESNAALMVVCQNSLFVLYGSPGAFTFTPQSRVQGAQADSTQDIGGVVGFDASGVVRYPTTQAFGNFLWDRLTLKIDALVKGKTVQSSVFVTGTSKYRIFFTDGTAISGFPLTRIQSNGSQQTAFDWSVIDLGVQVYVTDHAEINGMSRTFYGSADGWVYEADKGRSLAGQPIQYAIVLCPLSQGSTLTLKTYRSLQLEVTAQSACTLYTTGEFLDPEVGEQITTPQYGAAALYDLTNFDESYYGVPETTRRLLPLVGVGSEVTVTVAGESDNELPHILTALSVLYIPRRTIR